MGGTKAVTVRVADLAVDGDAVVAMIDAYARDPTARGEPLPDAIKRALVPGLRAQPGAVVLLAFDGDQPIGVAVCFLGFSTFAARPLLNVHDLAVVDAHRGRGVSRLLLDAIEAEGRARGCCKITLEVLEKNERARHVYLRFGFSDYQLDPRMGSALMMEKKL